jgi:hypothetical protein
LWSARCPDTGTAGAGGGSGKPTGGNTGGAPRVDLTASSTHAPAWVDELSPFAHLAAVPNAPPDWEASAAMTTVGVAFAIIGVGGYQHRDLAV